MNVKLNKVLRDIMRGRLSEAHLKVDGMVLIVENEGRVLRCLLYCYSDYYYGGDPITIAYKKPAELKQYLTELKERYRAGRVRVIG